NVRGSGGLRRANGGGRRARNPRRVVRRFCRRKESPARSAGAIAESDLDAVRLPVVRGRYSAVEAMKKSSLLLILAACQTRPRTIVPREVAMISPASGAVSAKLIPDPNSPDVRL